MGLCKVPWLGSYEVGKKGGMAQSAELWMGREGKAYAVRGREVVVVVHCGLPVT